MVRAVVLPGTAAVPIPVPVVLAPTPQQGYAPAAATMGNAPYRIEPTRGFDWVRLAEAVLESAQEEAKEFAVQLQRRRWGRMGVLLKKHAWCIKFRGKYFEPRWYIGIKKRWARISFGAAGAAASSSSGRR